jgi:hypothetical protein
LRYLRFGRVWEDFHGRDDDESGEAAGVGGG